MSKYYLVASYFNGRDFQGEITIPEISGTSLSTIQEIDAFTAGTSKSEILWKIEKDLNIKGKNQLAIKYYKNKDATPVYYRVIFNNKDFQEATQYIATKTYRLPNKVITAPCFAIGTVLYRKELEKINSLLEQKNLELFQRYYPYQDELLFLVRRYISTIYEDIVTKNEDYQMIVSEFSRYKTFRGWIIAQENLSRQTRQINTRQSLPTKKLPIEPKSVEEHEEDYLKHFQKTKGVSYDAYQTTKHNLAYLDEDQEEYLEEDEIGMMYEESPVIKIQRK